MKHFTSLTQRVGMLGEKIARQFLENSGFSILETNYTKQIGEIDIVAAKKGIIHFVEVKTLIQHKVSHETSSRVLKPMVAGRATADVSRETSSHSESVDLISPFQNISQHKLRKFSRTCEWYLLERGVSHETRWVIDAIAVTLYPTERAAVRRIMGGWNAKVEVMWNVIK